MELLNLPAELLATIFEQVVVALGLQRSLRAQLVCKRFSAEIVDAICRTDILLCANRPLFFVPIEWLARLVKVKVLNERWRGHPAEAAVRDNVDMLMNTGAYGSDRVQCLEIVCRCLVQFKGGQGTIYALRYTSESLATRIDAHERIAGRLAIAAYVGNLRLFQTIEDEATHIDKKSYFFGTPIWAAAIQNNVDILKYIVSKLSNESIHDDCNAQSEINDAALQEGAGTFGHQEVAKILLDYRKLLGISHDGVADTMNEAAENGHLSVLKYLFNQSFLDPANLPSYHAKVLFFACLGGHTAVVKHLLSYINPREVIFFDQRGSCFHAACLGGHADVVALLLPIIGPYFMAFAHHDRLEDPLCRAAKYGHVPVIRLLLDEGAPVDGTYAVDEFTTPLTLAAEHGQYAAVKLLLERGATVGGKVGAKLMCQAVQTGEECMVKLLTMHGCDANTGIDEERPPIVIAAESEQWHIKQLLEEELDSKSKVLVCCSQATVNGTWLVE